MSGRCRSKFFGALHPRAMGAETTGGASGSTASEAASIPEYGEGACEADASLLPCPSSPTARRLRGTASIMRRGTAQSGIQESFSAPQRRWRRSAPSSATSRSPGQFRVSQPAGQYAGWRQSRQRARPRASGAISLRPAFGTPLAHAVPSRLPSLARPRRAAIN